MPQRDKAHDLGAQDVSTRTRAPARLGVGWGAPSILPVPFSGTPRRLGTSSDARRQSPQSSGPREFRHPGRPCLHHLRAARQARPCSSARTPAASRLATQRQESLTGRCAGASVLSATVPRLPLRASGTQRFGTAGRGHSRIRRDAKASPGSRARRAREGRREGRGLSEEHALSVQAPPTTRNWSWPRPRQPRPLRGARPSAPPRSGAHAPCPRPRCFDSRGGA